MIYTCSLSSKALEHSKFSSKFEEGALQRFHLGIYPHSYLSILNLFALSRDKLQVINFFVFPLLFMLVLNDKILSMTLTNRLKHYILPIPNQYSSQGPQPLNYELLVGYYQSSFIVQKVSIIRMVKIYEVLLRS